MPDIKDLIKWLMRIVLAMLLCTLIAINIGPPLSQIKYFLIYELKISEDGLFVIAIVPLLCLEEFIRKCILNVSLNTAWRSSLAILLIILIQKRGNVKDFWDREIRNYNVEKIA